MRGREMGRARRLASPPRRRGGGTHHGGGDVRTPPRWHGAPPQGSLGILAARARHRPVRGCRPSSNSAILARPWTSASLAERNCVRDSSTRAPALSRIVHTHHIECPRTATIWSVMIELLPHPRRLRGSRALVNVPS